jgi:hypothetical protein
LDLAGLALDEGKPADAQVAAARAIELLRGEKSPADEASGQSTLARIYAAQAKFVDAEEALKLAMALSHNSASLPLHFELAIAAAEVRGAEVGKANRGAALETKKMLQAALQQARLRGYLGYELRLRLAWIKFESGLAQPGSTRQELEQLRRESDGKGFGSVSRAASQLLAMNLAH